MVDEQTTVVGESSAGVVESGKEVVIDVEIEVGLLDLLDQHVSAMLSDVMQRA